MLFCPEYNRVECGADGKSCWDSCVPMIANTSVDSKDMLEGEISDGDEYNVQADDDEGSNAKIGYNATFYTVERLTSVENSEKEAEIDGVEEGDVQHVISRIEGLHVPLKEQDA